LDIDFTGNEVSVDVTGLKSVTLLLAATQQSNSEVASLVKIDMSNAE
jgi:hypothetical protein